MKNLSDSKTKQLDQGQINTNLGTNYNSEKCVCKICCFLAGADLMKPQSQLHVDLIATEGLVLWHEMRELGSWLYCNLLTLTEPSFHNACSMEW